MRFFLIAIFISFSSVSFADTATQIDIDVIKRLEYDTHHICRQPVAPPNLSDEACNFRDKLREELTRLGYKFDASERIWIKK